MNHRVRQRRCQTGALLIILISAFSSTSVPADAEAPTDHSAGRDVTPSGRVLIVAAPSLTWEGVRNHPTPMMTALFDRSAVASLSTRTGISGTTPANAYLTLAAGNRVGSSPDPSDGWSGVFLAPADPIDVGLPTRPPSSIPGDRGVAASPVVGVLADAAKSGHYDSQLGALSESLRGSGRSIAAVGNAGTSRQDLTRREIGWAAAGPDGVLRAGDVGPDLISLPATGSDQRSVDNAATAAAVATAWATADVVVVELSELRDPASTNRAPSDSSLDHGDELVGLLLAQMRPEDTVIVAGVVPPDGTEQLTVFSMAGPGLSAGLATSSSTRRPGYVALTDIAPTVLGSFGIVVPSSMDNTRITGDASGRDLTSRLDDLIDANDRAITRDASWATIASCFVVILLIALVLTLLVHRGSTRLDRPVRVLTIWVLWIPVFSFLIALAPIGGLTPLALGLWIFGSTLAAALATLAALDARIAAVVLATFTWLVLTVDTLTGAQLQISTTFGYSPILAGRFAGMGNVAFAIYTICALIMISAGLDTCPRDAAGRPGRSTAWAIVGLLIITIVVDGAPPFGSDVGGVLALVPTAVVVIVLSLRIRIRPVTIALGVVAPLAVIAGFAWLDLSRPVDQRTHLGRFAAKLADPGVGDVLSRKLAASASQFQLPVAWAIPIAMIAFAYWTWRPTTMVSMVADRHPGYRMFAISALWVGLVSMLVNDSGVSLPAMMMAFSLAYLCILYIDAARQRSVLAQQPAEAVPVT